MRARRARLPCPFDVLVGINLLREGLDIPEVALVAILDADKEGFLRSARSLIQTIGRAARNVDGRVIMYADRVTDSMAAAIDETNRRRAAQVAHNTAHGITPKTISRAFRAGPRAEEYDPEQQKKSASEDMRLAAMSPKELDVLIGGLKKSMLAAAQNLEFEKAAELRDRIRSYEAILLGSPR